MNCKYTPEQIEYLKAGYRLMHTRDLTKAFNAHFGTNRTQVAVSTVLTKRKIKCGRAYGERLIPKRILFSPEQELFVREEYKKRTIAELTPLFNAHFGTTFTVGQVKALTSRKKIHSGRTGCFSKGNKAWNSGTKGQGLTGANPGSFKKGTIPPNRRPMGSERISKDGFIEIKVAERNPNTGFPTRFKHKQRHVWEQNYGPIPKGKAVAFRDSDSLNCEPGNLMLVSRAELLALNRNKYKKMPLELKPSVEVLSRLQVKTKIREKEAR